MKENPNEASLYALAQKKSGDQVRSPKQDQKKQGNP